MKDLSLNELQETYGGKRTSSICIKFPVIVPPLLLPECPTDSSSNCTNISISNNGCSINIGCISGNTGTVIVNGQIISGSNVNVSTC